MPKTPPTLTGQKPFIMAHRGNQVRYPENTLSAFRQAILDGADIIETDIQVSADLDFFCIHDPTVDRTTDGQGMVRDLSSEVIRSFNAAAQRPDLEPEPIPMLSEFIQITSEGTWVGLELKSERFSEPEVCARLIHKLQEEDAFHRSFALSFHPEHLRAIQLVAPDFPIGWITLSRFIPKNGYQMIGPIWPILFVNPLYVWIAHQMGQWVCPLDPNPNSRLWYYRRLGCDAVLTDDSGSTAQALRRSTGALE